jgi:hypothetical protein
VDKVEAVSLKAEIDTALADPTVPAESKVELETFKDKVDALIADSLLLDDRLLAIVNETDKAKRVKAAQEIKDSLPGLLGEDCSTLP